MSDPSESPQYETSSGRLGPRLRVFVPALLLTLALSGSAVAQTSDADIATAENAYAALDYPTALSGAEAVLSKGNLSHDALVRATRVAALSNAALGQTEPAKALFTTLLELDPDFKVDAKQGPRFSQPFAEARGFYLSKGRKGQLDVQATATSGQPAQMRTAVSDPLGIVKSVVVGYRWAPQREFTTVKVEAGTHTTDLPANPKGATRLDYWVRAVGHEWIRRVRARHHRFTTYAVRHHATRRRSGRGTEEEHFRQPALVHHRRRHRDERGRQWILLVSPYGFHDIDHGAGLAGGELWQRTLQLSLQFYFLEMEQL